MAFSFLKIPFESRVLPYDDEETPLQLMGKKMLPIVEFHEENIRLNESLDIIVKADTTNQLGHDLLKGKDAERINDLLSRLGGPIHNLVMPYWVYTQEFNQQSRTYFLAKKELKRGPFNKLMRKAPTFLSQLPPLLEEVENMIASSDIGIGIGKEGPTIFDIMLASHLWGLYVLPEFQFSPKIHQYLQEVKLQCSFNYHEDYWSKD